MDSKLLVARAVATPPVIDGALDDGVWHSAGFVADFVQKQPIEGAPPSHRTEIAVVHDGEALYVGARMYAGGPGDVQAIMTRRDDTGKAEHLVVSLDTFGAGRTAYSFAVTAAGVRADWYHPDDDESIRDFSFEPIWSARSQVYPWGWTAEMRIPFTQLRYVHAARQRWRINFSRSIPHRNETVYWIPVPKTHIAWASYFGELRGLETIEPVRRLELLPYIAADLTAFGASGGSQRSYDMGLRAGGDVKLGLGPNLTLDATIYPDFGQVEADPAEVNLSGTETVFEERRPFFTEGKDLLLGRGPQYFYSRRIGTAPRVAADGGYTAQPRTTPILGAAKLVGYLPSGLSIGTLVAVTPRTHVDVYSEDTDTRERVALAPLTGYSAFRIEQARNRSIVGASLTALLRDIDAGSERDAAFADLLVGQAYTGGVDWSLRLARERFEVHGYAGFSHVRGQPGAILETARSPVHLFQRPDQDHVELDPDARSMSGYTALLGYRKRTGAWRWGVSAGADSPGFEINELGSLPKTDDLYGKLDLSYRQVEPSHQYHDWQLGLETIGEWNYGGILDSATVAPFGQITWPNFWTSSLQASIRTPGQNDYVTRGGPLLGTGWGGQVDLAIASSEAARNSWNTTASYRHHEIGKHGLEVSGGVTLRPVDRLRLSLTPRYVRITDNRQYIDAIPGSNEATFGTRYVFGTIDFRELAVQVRVGASFTTDLSIDAYVEPFASSGRYQSIGELHAARSTSLDVYGADIGTIERCAQGSCSDPAGDGYEVTVGDEVFSLASPDFTYLSLRSTVSLRWELTPGSHLFVVWQQDRSDAATEVRAITPARWGDAFASPSRHDIILKLSYWWPAG